MLLGRPTLRTVDSFAFSSFSVLVEGDFMSNSICFCLAFIDFEARFPVVLLRESFLSAVDFPRTVTVGREPSRGTESSFSMARVAAR